MYAVQVSVMLCDRNVPCEWIACTLSSVVTELGVHIS